MIPQNEHFPGRKEGPSEINLVEHRGGDLPTKYGRFMYVVYEVHTGGFKSDVVYPVLIKKVGEETGKTPLVRIHSKCVTGDAAGSLRCDCGDQLHESMRKVDKHGGVVVYANDHEGRGNGFKSKIESYKLQEEGLDTVEADHALGLPEEKRDYSISAAILYRLGMSEMAALLTNNPTKQEELKRHGIYFFDCEPIIVGSNPHNIRYLETKRLKMGHILPPADEK